MVLRRRQREQQQPFRLANDQLGSGPRNAFYDRLNQLLAEIEFDRKLEKSVERYYEKIVRRNLSE